MREEEDGEGTSEARTRALNEILRGTEVVGSLARPLGSCSAGWPVAALVAQLPPGLVRVPTTTRATAAPPMGELDGRREMGPLGQSEAATWAGLAGGSLSLRRTHEVLATAHASTHHHALALRRILMRTSRGPSAAAPLADLRLPSPFFFAMDGESVFRMSTRCLS